MFMVGSGYAFGRALVIWLWSIVWLFIGFIIAVLVTDGALISMFTNPNGFAANPGPALPSTRGEFKQLQLLASFA